MKKSWNRMFVHHPQSVNETYLEHMGQAFYFGTSMFFASICCIIHGLVPGLFTSAGSQTVEHLYDRMVQNRLRNSTQSGESTGRIVRARD